MSNTLALLLSVPNLVILYLITYFTQSLSGKRQFYGVSLNADYFNNEEFKNLDKRYKRLLTIGFVLTLLITLSTIYVFNSPDTAILICVFGYIFCQMASYIDVHKKVKSLKSQLACNISDVDLEKTTTVFDSDFLAQKDKIVKKYSILYILPTILVLMAIVYAFTKYDSMPNMIGIHWGPSGEADQFVEKSMTTVVGFIGTIVFLSILICISSIYPLKSRAKLSGDNVEASKKENLKSLNRLGVAFLVLNTLTQLLCVSILISFANNSPVSPIFVWGYVVLIILATVYLSYVYYKLPSKSKNASYSVEDEDSLWILGMFYNNPNDPALFVTERFGVGYTINIGHLKGKILFVLPFIIIIIAFMID